MEDGSVDTEDKTAEQIASSPEPASGKDLLDNLTLNTTVEELSLKRDAESQNDKDCTSSIKEELVSEEVGPSERESSPTDVAESTSQDSTTHSSTEKAAGISIEPSDIADQTAVDIPAAETELDIDIESEEMLTEEVNLAVEEAAAPVTAAEEEAQSGDETSRQEDNPNDVLFVKRLSNEKLDSDTSTHSQEGHMGVEMEEVTSDVDEGLDIIPEGETETVGTEPASPSDDKEEKARPRTQNGQRKKQAGAVKKKDGVKRIKTAPGKLANIIATKTPAQQRSIVSGVTKRLVSKQQPSQSELTYGKMDITTKSEDMKSLSLAANQKSQSSIATNGVSLKSQKPKEKKTPPKRDLGSKSSSKASSDKLVDKTKKVNVSNSSTSKPRKDGLEKPVNTAKKEPKLANGNTQLLSVVNEVKDNNTGTAAPTEEEGLPEAALFPPEKINLDLPEEPLGDRKCSTISTDSNLAIRMHQAKQESEANQAANEKKTEVLPVKLMSNDGSLLKSLIPYLPLPLAVTCLVLNILVPGAGTIVSGFSVLCCGRPRVDGKDDRLSNTVILNLFVGLAQMATITFMLVGWFWSIFWGIYMVVLAKSENSKGGAGDGADNDTVLV